MPSTLGCSPTSLPFALQDCWWQSGSPPCPTCSPTSLPFGDQDCNLARVSVLSSRHTVTVVVLVLAPAKPHFMWARGTSSTLFTTEHTFCGNGEVGSGAYSTSRNQQHAQMHGFPRNLRSPKSAFSGVQTPRSSVCFQARLGTTMSLKLAGKKPLPRSNLCQADSVGCHGTVLPWML